MSLNLTKEFVLRKELLEKIEKETLQAEEVGKGKTLYSVFLLLSTRTLSDDEVHCLMVPNVPQWSGATVHV